MKSCSINNKKTISVADPLGRILIPNTHTKLYCIQEKLQAKLNRDPAKKRKDNNQTNTRRVGQCTMSKTNVCRSNILHEDRDMDLAMLYLQREKRIAIMKSLVKLSLKD